MRVGSRGSLSTAADAPTDTAQHAAVRADIATLEIGLDHSATESPEISGTISTFWHRQSSVVISVEYL